MKNINIDFKGIKNNDTRAKVEDLFVSLENRCPKLYKVIDEVAKESTINGPITLKFVTEAPKDHPEFNACWYNYTREIVLMIENDEQNSFKMNLINSFIFELHNASNTKLTNISILTFESANEYALAVETAEY